MKSFKEYISEFVDYNPKKHEWKTAHYKDGSAHAILIDKKKKKIVAGAGMDAMEK